MFARLPNARKIVARFFALVSVLWLTACDPRNFLADALNLPVKVALLVPGGSIEDSDNFLAMNLENAARLAIADLDGVNIDLRVYNTSGTAEQAAAAARAAADDGARIIIGPLYAESANAAGLAVANRGINVLAFSNKLSIAGGNVFILGSTFQNTANRLVSYSTRQGINSYMVVHATDSSGVAGRDAIVNAIRSNGGQLAGVESYPLSQTGIYDSTLRIVERIEEENADAIFMTGGVTTDLPIIVTALDDAGIDPTETRFIGLTRWDAVPQTLVIPGLQNGIFAMPDKGMMASFANRYEAAYGSQPHPIAGLGYDAIAAIGALVESNIRDPFSTAALTQPQGFRGTSGIFRLLPNGQNERGMAVATVVNSQVVVLEPAPRSFGNAGF